MSILSTFYSILILFTNSKSKTQRNNECLKNNTHRMTNHFKHRYMERVSHSDSVIVSKDFAGALTSQHDPFGKGFRWHKIYYCIQKKCFKLKGNKYVYILWLPDRTLITMRPLEKDRNTKGHFRVPVTELEDIVRIKLAFGLRF